MGQHSIATNTREHFQSETWRKLLPGMIMVLLIALFTQSLGNEYPVIGGAVMSIFVGILIRNFIGIPNIYEPGISYILGRILKLSIILLGFSLNFSEVLKIGFSSLSIVLICVTMGIAFTYFIAKAFGLSGNIPVLIGVGTAICGATAIVTTGPIIEAQKEEMAYAVNTIFGFNILAVLVYPLIGLWMSMPDHDFGVWVGTAIQDTSSVVAAGYVYSDDAGAAAIIVKLIRTLMLVVVAVGISIWYAAKLRKEKARLNTRRVKISRIFPYFILVFAGVAILNSIVAIPVGVSSTAGDVAKFMILMVMVSVGLGTDFKKIKTIGPRPFIVGLLSSVLMGVTSLILIHLLV